MMYEKKIIKFLHPTMYFLVTLMLVAFFNIKVQAQSNKEYRTARETAPAKMGWMQGSPPSDSLLLSAADGSFFTFPKMRYSVCHMRQFLPTTNVGRGVNSKSSLDNHIDKQINNINFKPWGADTTMSWEQSLWKNYTDGIIVIHKGNIVYERYLGCLDESGKHAAMSVTKSFTGTLASMLVAEGKLDPTAEVSSIIPELRNSAFGDATVRQVMNMTTSLKYSEDYANPDAEIWTYAKATNPLPKPKSYEGPEGTFEYLQTLEKDKDRDHGEAFAYKTPNADLLGWIVSRAAGKPIDQLLSDRIWSKLGMEQSAYYQLDAKGTPSTGGGLSLGMRDMARFGQLLLNNGQWNDTQVIPSDAVANIRKGGSTEKFAKSDHPKLKGWSYKNLWWITNNKDGAFAARGVHGQTIYVDPKADMVIVRFASHPVAANAGNDATSLPAYQAVADYLMNK